MAPIAPHESKRDGAGGHDAAVGPGGTGAGGKAIGGGAVGTGAFV